MSEVIDSSGGSLRRQVDELPHNIQQFAANVMQNELIGNFIQHQVTVEFLLPRYLQAQKDLSALNCAISDIFRRCGVVAG